MREPFRQVNLVTVLSLGLIVAFGTISICNLDRFPPVQEDEPWILSPGYKLFSEGIFGSDLITGYYGMERHYLEFMPLMSVLQGATTRLFGLGVFQMRVTPVLLGTLTLVLTYVLARKLIGLRAGLIAVLLLFFWQWRGGNDRILGTGIPLIDVSRIARYDILVAPLGLGAWWAWLAARRTGRYRQYFLAGLLAGMAGLAHLYGLFWLIALLISLLLERLYFTRRPVFRETCALVCGATAVWLFWIVIIVSNWSDYTGQMLLSPETFRPLSISFYVENVLNERHRYAFDARTPATLARSGFWLMIVGVPAGLLWLSVRVARHRDVTALWLLVPSLIFPLIFTLLVRTKRFDYLVSVAPLFAILLAGGLVRLLESRHAATRRLAFIVLAVAVLQGSLAIVRMQWTASQTEKPDKFFAELRQSIPPSARVLGREVYWLALADREYRSFFLPFILSDPERSKNPIPFAQAMNQSAPQVVLLDPIVSRYFEDHSRALTSKYRDEFWAYMRQHNARLVREIRDNSGVPVQVHQLER